MTNEAGSLDLRNRDALFGALEAGTFDVAVIGGGITGAGVARDAAMRGLKVALIEARDFGSGTSSRSSKMIHGGLRYLAMGDVALVREAASERKVVQAIAPHLARETPFVMPARNVGAVAKLRAGLWTFEKLGGVPKSRKHEVWSQSELQAREPAIASAEMVGAVVYPEYLTDDARLTLANARSAAAHGAVVANYAAASAIVTENGRAVGIEVRETLPGAAPQTARLAGKTIVNAAGPWVDAIRALEAPGAAGRLKLTKGVHLVVPREKLPVSRTVIFSAADRRSVFAVPKGETTYIGTTDTFHPTTEDWPEITAADVDYLLSAAAPKFSTLPSPMPTSPRPGRVCGRWSARRASPPPTFPARTSFGPGRGGVLSIAGGKLTAYRQMAERVVDQIEEALGRKRSRSRTAMEPLPGGDADPAVVTQALVAAGLGEREAIRRAGLDGAEAETVAAGAAGEAVQAVLYEGAATLEDYWVRRGARAWFDLDPAFPALTQAGNAMAPLLGWSDDERRRQIDHCRDLRRNALAFQGALTA